MTLKHQYRLVQNGVPDRYDRFYIYLPAETTSHVQKFMEVCAVIGGLDFLLLKNVLLNRSIQTTVYHV